MEVAAYSARFKGRMNNGSQSFPSKGGQGIFGAANHLSCEQKCKLRYIAQHSSYPRALRLAFKESNK